jgi:N-acetyl-alpha-D-muramate 1-phosphate uridylyltransferase
MLPVVILAGGLATRMKPITEKIPKSLIEVNGKPFILHQLDYLKSQGIQNIVLCIGHLGHMIESLIGDGKALGLNIQYSLDGNKLLGTGGAIKKALPLLSKDFFVLYGDSFLPIDYKDVEDAYVSSKKNALITLIKNNNQWDKSNVEFATGTLIEYNKYHPNQRMHYIDYGLSILNQSIFDAYLENESFDLSDLYHKLSLHDHLAGFETFERFYEIGSQNGLKETENYLSKV